MWKILALISTGFVSFFVSTALQQEPLKNETVNNIKSVNQSSEITSAINEFWQASLQGNTEQLSEVITKVPNDYYNTLNKCDRETGEIDKRLNSKTLGLNQITKGTDESKVEFEYNSVLLVSSKIMKGDYASYKILKERETGNHALVEVEYGKDDKFRPHVDLFLLNKENEKWKVFMNTHTWYLLEDNKYFAKSDCSQ